MQSWTWDKSWARKEELGHWTTSFPKLSLLWIHLWLFYSMFCSCLTNFKTRKNRFMYLFKIWCASLKTQHCANIFYIACSITRQSHYLLRTQFMGNYLCKISFQQNFCNKTEMSRITFWQCVIKTLFPKKLILQSWGFTK